MTRALACGERKPCTYKGDFNVSSALRYFSGVLAAGIFGVPHRRRPHPPSVGNRGDLFGGALPQEVVARKFIKLAVHLVRVGPGDAVRPVDVAGVLLPDRNVRP